MINQEGSINFEEYFGEAAIVLKQGQMFTHDNRLLSDRLVSDRVEL